MRVLLVDDNVRHRRAGKRQLEAAGHEVVALSSYQEARQQAQDGQFDVALLDLLMPAEGFMLGAEARKEHLGREMGIGFPMILALALAGIPRIAVATDTNHHNHPMSAIVDWFGNRNPLTVNGSHVLIMHSPMAEEGAKDWAQVLKLLSE